MGALNRDVPLIYDATRPPSLAQIRAAISTTFYRGSLVHSHNGDATNAPLQAEPFMGVVWSRHVVPAGALVTVGVTGRFRFDNATFVGPNYGDIFAVNSSLSDNPADLALLNFGSAGAAGALDHISDDGIRGWINIDRRA